MKREILVLIILILMVVTLNYSFIDSALSDSFKNYETGVVERVIDGDTVVINGTSIRLLGLNSPEKGEKFYTESRNFLEEKVLEKEVRLVFGKDKFDLYGRKLAYLFIGSYNVNLESVKEGHSNFYFPSGKDSFYDEFVLAWEECLSKNMNLCEKSAETCLKLETWDIKGQKVVLKNICSKNLDISGWSIKDEGRKKYILKNKILSPEEKLILTTQDWNKTYVWTATGDSIFIRDSEGKLVYWDSY